MSLTLCDPLDCSLPGSSVHGISQARILEWVAIPPPGDLPNPGIKPISLAAPTFAGGFFPIVPPGRSLEMNSGYFWVLLVFTSSDYLEFYLGILKLLSDDKFLEVGLLGQRI